MDTLRVGTATTIPSGSPGVTKIVVPVTAGDQFQITFKGVVGSGLVVVREPEGDTVRITTAPTGSDQLLVNFQSSWTGIALVVVPPTTSSLELTLQRRIGGVLLDRWEPDSTLANGPMAGSTLVSRTLHPGDDDYFQIPGATDSEFTVRIEGKTRGRASLLDSTGKIVRTIAIPESAGIASKITYRTGSTKPWGLLVESISMTDTGGYSVKVTGRWVLPLDRWECARCASSSDTPDTLVVGGPGNIRSLTPMDFDRSVVRCDSGRQYLFRASSTKPMTFVVRQPSGWGTVGKSHLELSNGGLVMTPNQSGWMTIESEFLASTDSGTYSFEVSLAPEVKADSFEPDDTRSQGRRIAADSALHTGTFTEDDQDWYQFQADSGSYYKLELLGQVGTTVTRYKAVTADYIGSIGNFPGGTIVLEATRSGTMTFLVSPRDEVGSYGLRLSKLKVTTVDAAEPDNDTATARDIPLDSTVLSGNMEPDGVDWFRFPVTTGMRYSLSFSSESGTLSPMFYGSSNQILSSAYACMESMCSQGWTATYTGTAYIQMDGPSATFTTYKVALRELKAP